MKYLYFFILFANFYNVKAQYGQEGAVLVGLEIGIRSFELAYLNEIAEAQDDIVILHGLIAATTADIVRIEQIKLDSESDLQPWVNDMSSMIRVGLTATQLVELQGEIIDIAQEVPAFLPFITESMLVLIADSGIIVNDLGIAIRENETSLMDNKARIDIINASQDGLDYLVSKSLEILKLMETLSKLNVMENAVGEEFTMDYTEILERSREKMDNLVIE